MTITCNFPCSQSASPMLPYALGDVGIHTTGKFDGNVPMNIGKNTYWKTSSNFTRHFLSLAERLQGVVQSTQRHKIIAAKTFYYWEGGRPISDPISCFENEQCTVNVTWDGKSWISKLSKEWIKTPSFEIPIWSKTSYIRTKKGKKIKFSLTFNGPKEKAVYFNRMIPIIQLQNNWMLSSLFISKYWLNCSHSAIMEGVWEPN
ncbi:hypothetical protein DSO57_1017520 [Entomophthora muscae]|uniref:Uncharacterized protein n=1 Tax=Entomophthora muscae TaxID=34485 RepID=A0ACC2T500_9FUNG|nr:hypothetical protein DSO57_1017520 [Entomophthora muscae]